MVANITMTIDGVPVVFNSTEQATAHLMKHNKPPKNQKQFVLAHLLKHKQITRNFALSHYLTRLSSIINILNGEGYQIEGEDGVNGIDYIYTLNDATLF